MKFQDNSYNRINNNKCPSSEKEDEVCILRNSYFHQIQPRYNYSITPFLPGPGVGTVVRGQGQGERDLDTLGGDQE